MVLSPRERLLLGVLAAMVVVFALYYALQGIRTYEQGLVTRVAAREVMLKRARELSREMAALRRPPARSSEVRTPLIGYIERLAARNRLKERIQLNLIPQERTGGIAGIDIKVDELTLDEMVELVYTLENAGRRLVIDRIEISPAFRSKQRLRLTLRVLTKG